MPDDAHRSQYRFPNSLLAKLQEASKVSRRSLNGELVYRLETTYAEPAAAKSHPVHPDAVRKMLATLTLAELTSSAAEDRHSSHYRLPVALYQRLRDEAQDDGRTINDLIVDRLRSTFEPAWLETLRNVISGMTVAELTTERALEAVLPALTDKLNTALSESR